MRWRPETLLVAMTLLAGCAPSVASSGAPLPVAESSPVVALQATTTAAGTLYAPADLQPAQRQAWLDRIAHVSAALAVADLGPLDDEWDGQLVVELPATVREYTTLAGSGSDQAAAVTRCDTGGSRVAINPRIEREAAEYLDALLLHEAVHAVTGSACSAAPLWIEEGLAEWLTAQHHPATQEANQQWLAHELASGGLPTGLPGDSAFEGTAAQVSGSYALASFAVATAVEHLGHGPAMAYLAAPDQPTTRLITQWYLAGLRAWLVPPVASASAPR